MVNEAVLVLKYEDPIDFIVDNAGEITKGAVLKLADARLASLSDAAADIVAGIAARDKVANDGRTRLAVFRRGVFRMRASGSVAAGDAVETAASDHNFIKTNTTAKNGSVTLGYALENIGDGEWGEVELNIQATRNHT